jgi:hypothetical protein
MLVTGLSGVTADQVSQTIRVGVWKKLSVLKWNPMMSLQAFHACSPPLSI